jgi:putative MATE family efflux protein
MKHHPLQQQVHSILWILFLSLPSVVSFLSISNWKHEFSLKSIIITHPGRQYSFPLQRQQALHQRQRLFPRQYQLFSSNFNKNSDTANEDSSFEFVEKKRKELSKEFLSIGLPALIQLAAEPLASLVDTAYLGRLGPEVLGGAGVAISAHYAVSKLYNDPLLRTSISLVASQDGKSRTNGEDDLQDHDIQDMTTNKSNVKEKNKSNNNNHNNKELSLAVSSALLLALTVGMVQLVVYTILSSTILRGMGLEGPSNPMWQSALSYLRVRAFGTPAATLWLVTNGIFRGLGNTRTPLIYSLVFTVLNIILDPLFIFTFQWGASGAAAGTAIAQFVALVPLLVALHRDNVPFLDSIWGQWKELKTAIAKYLEAGSLVLIRTFGKVFAYAVCARQAALLGSVGAAAYNLTFQLGFATTQICEAVAVAVQTLLAYV